MGEWDRPAPDAHLERLGALVGHWCSRDEHFPMPWAPNGGKGESSQWFRHALDGYCFLADLDGQTPFGPLKGHAIFYADKETGRLRAFWYDTFANALDGEGGFDSEGRFVMEYGYRMAGADQRERHTIEMGGPDTYEHRIEIVVDGRFQLAAVLRFRREPAHAPGRST